MIQKIKSWLSRPSLRGASNVKCKIDTRPNKVQLISQSQAEEMANLLNEIREDKGSSVGPRTTIKAPDTPPPLPMHKGAILGNGTVEVVSNKTTEKKLSNGSVYHEQTIEFSINKPLDYMAIMGTKRQTKRDLEFIKDMKDAQNIRDEVNRLCKLTP